MYINNLSQTQPFEELATPRTSLPIARSEAPNARDPFGADVVLENSGGDTEEQLDSYGSDARMLATLKARDDAVRDKARSEGEAVGGRQLVYQTGPDGQQYAVGSLAHLVRKDGSEAALGNTGSPAADPQDDPQNAALTEKLRQRDAHVRAHEMAHIMAAGGQAQGMPHYTYQTGPDGRAYAIGGSVNISVTGTGDPEHDARQAQVAQRAATAVGDPSARDSLTASQAGAMAQSAKQRALDSYAGQSDNRPDFSLTV